MFTETAEFYDIIYSWKDYGSEAALVRGYIEQYKAPRWATLCSTWPAGRASTHSISRRITPSRGWIWTANCSR